MKKIIILLLLILPIAACSGSDEGAYDTNTEVPEGDPDFPSLEYSWVIDSAHVLSHDTIKYGSMVFDRLKNEGIAEVVLVTMKGISHPEDWATHYGRWLKLGKKGLSTEGGNRGLVWLIRPDKEKKITYSAGRGLPLIGSGDFLDIMTEAKEFFNLNNFDEGVCVLIDMTDKQLRLEYRNK